MKRRDDRDEEVKPIARQIEQLARALQTPPGRHGLLIGENSWLSKCCFHLTLIFLTLIFVGFRPSKIQMALSLKTRNFNFGDPTTPRTPSYHSGLRSAKSRFKNLGR